MVNLRTYSMRPLARKLMVKGILFFDPLWMLDDHPGKAAVPRRELRWADTDSWTHK